jgi:hypothetical protein
MADGTQPQKTPAINDGLTNDQFDELSLGIDKALALSDVLNEWANAGMGAEQLHEHTLATYSGMLYEVLRDVRGIIDASLDVSIAARDARRAALEAKFEADYAARLAANRPAEVPHAQN